MQRREFSVEEEYAYDRRTPVRWLVSHVARYPYLPLAALPLSVLSSLLGAQAPRTMGRTFDHVLSPTPDARTLLTLSLATLGLGLGQVALDALYRVCLEFLSRRVARDVRGEFYASLLGKSLTFHRRQRIGDLMARATGDTRRINYTFSPSLRVLLSTAIRLAFLLATIGAMRLDWLFVPLAMLVAATWALRRYAREIDPVAEAQRAQFGALSARLAEAIAGVEVVKANAQEGGEEAKVRRVAGRWRDLYVRWGEVQARNLAPLAYYAALAAGFAHGLVLYARGATTLGQVVAYVGLLSQFEPVTTGLVSLLSLIARGMAGARRILEMVNVETELDENRAGVHQPVRGEVAFEGVSFAYDGRPALHGISFCARPGETVAIVGATGSGKSTLTRLINRIYEAGEGRVLVDGVDVRDWNLDALRSQMATIDQDVTLLGRSVAENIAFGARRTPSRDEIERCARQAQAHDFIARLAQGYDTVIGERGVTLSGGERQRVAIARALIGDPRILILDDATSAIDSATEDRIQAAMHRVRQGRTTFLITHRLSMIRWADRILVLRQGALVDQGTHDELIGRCPAYRRIFARRDGG